MPIASQSVRKPSRVYLRRGHPLTQGLVVAWPIFTGVDTRLFDVSGHQHHGTSETSSWLTSNNGTVFDLDGTSETITYPNTGTFGQNDAFSLAFVTRLDNGFSFDDGKVFLWHSRGESDRSVLLDNSAPRGVWVTTYDGTSNSIKTGYQFPIDTYALIGVTHDGSGNYDVYCRASTDTDPTIVSGSLPTPNQTSDTNVVGSQESGSLDQRHWDGKLYTVLMWDRRVPVDVFRSLYADPLLPFITKPR